MDNCEVGDLPEMGGKGQILLHDEGVGRLFGDRPERFGDLFGTDLEDLKREAQCARRHLRFTDKGCGRGTVSFGEYGDAGELRQPP